MAEPRRCWSCGRFMPAEPVSDYCADCWDEIDADIAADIQAAWA
jgi:hypothetical protein